jgi:hypothetical protein
MNTRLAWVIILLGTTLIVYATVWIALEVFRWHDESLLTLIFLLPMVYGVYFIRRGRRWMREVKQTNRLGLWLEQRNKWPWG